MNKKRKVCYINEHADDGGKKLPMTMTPNAGIAKYFHTANPPSTLLDFPKNAFPEKQQIFGKPTNGEN